MKKFAIWYFILNSVCYQFDRGLATLIFSGKVTTLVEPYVAMLNFYMLIVYYRRELSFYKWDDDEGHSGYYSRSVIFSDLFTALVFF
jgi:hypothetical protein